ncbi:GDSL-like Lipase/Acylhydrolase [Xylariomycetidae sp. FL0641]|nr:GDSL-like Lipase/Acylhydrolase [Xylariomycetidae sp. FL0641]
MYITMLRLLFALASLLAVPSAAALPQAAGNPKTSHHNSTNPPAFFLAGDSTTAVQSSNGGGWGNGFLSFLVDPAWGVNLGHNGATTVSFVQGGDWANTLRYVQNNSKAFDVYVTIQFGHNDQKESANISLAQYQANLEDLALDVKQAGGTPFLVTPLTRRSFTSEHNATDSLHEQRIATIAAANATGTAYLDLNRASLIYVDRIGNESAQAYNLNGDDTTHLNDYGSLVFGRMVADLMLREKQSLRRWIRPNETLSFDLWHGKPA